MRMARSLFILCVCASTRTTILFQPVCPFPVALPPPQRSNRCNNEQRTMRMPLLLHPAAAERRRLQQQRLALDADAGSSSSSSSSSATSAAPPAGGGCDDRSGKLVASDDEDDDDGAVASSSSCPFARYFPRHRIDLTPVKNDKADDSDSKNGGPAQLFSWPWKRTAARHRLEHLARQWKRSDGSSQQEETASVEFVWKEKVDGIAALGLLWRQASRLLTKQEATRSVVVVCALPDARRRVVRQWVDLFEWLLSLESFFADTHGVSVSYQEIENVPAVTLTTSTKPTQQITKPGNITGYNHDVITARTKSWVNRVLVKLRICPFTKSTTMAGQGLADVGVSAGSIAYHTSSASSVSAAGVCQLMADTWDAIDAMLRAGPEGKKGVSSILLAAPEYDDDFALWSGPVFALLEAGVLAARAEKEIGVVCFHPSYATPDGNSFPGFGHMHSVPRLEKWMNSYRAEQEEAARKRLGKASTSSSNDQLDAEKELSSAVCPVLSTEEIAAGGAWQRRTPHATINVLRADQLEAAEGRRSTPKLYSENILKLVALVGSDTLQKELEKERNIEL